MANVVWKDNHIEVAPPKHPKKITATRFATILGLNPWSTPFETWCAITRTYEKPFEDTIYTAAGKAIEPKQIAYMKKSYAMDNLQTPTDIYGKDYFKKTYGDFFHDMPVLGGMWDSLLVDENALPEAVLEFKTTKRSEDWAEDIPEYYALQAALYAYLLNVDSVIMIASFLSQSDYDAPDKFVPSADNTITRQFKVSERYPDFAERVEKAHRWWAKYVETGVSPDFDEVKDKEVLDELRKNTIAADEDIGSLVDEAEELQFKLDAVNAKTKDIEKRLKTLKDEIKRHMMAQFRDGDKKVDMSGKAYQWTLSRSDSLTFDEDAMKADGVLEKYKSKLSTTYRLTNKSAK